MTEVGGIDWVARLDRSVIDRQLQQLETSLEGKAFCIKLRFDTRQLDAVLKRIKEEANVSIGLGGTSSGSNQSNQLFRSFSGLANTSVSKFNQAISKDDQQRTRQNDELDKSVGTFDNSVTKFARQQGLIGIAQRAAAEKTFSTLKGVQKQRTMAFEKDLSTKVNSYFKPVTAKSEELISKSKSAIASQQKLPEIVRKAFQENKIKAPKIELTKTEALLTKLASLVDSISKKMSHKTTEAKTGTQSSFKEFSQRANSYDPNIRKRELTEQFRQLIPLMRLQGSRKGESIGDGGIKNLLQRFPQLQSEAGIHNRQLKELQADLSRSIENLIKDNNLEELNEIAAYMVNSWGKLARVPANSRRQNPLPNMGLPKISNTQAIQENWDDTGTHIAKQLERLAEISKVQGYEIQRNISEGSPGTTQRIREYWDKTIAHLSTKLDELTGKAQDSGESLEENIAPELNAFQQAIEPITSMFRNIGSEAEGGLQGVIETLKNVGLAGGLAVGGLVLGVTGVAGMVADGVGAAISKLGELISASESAAAGMESLAIKYDFVFGATETSRSLKQLAQQTNDLGLSVAQARQNYIDFAGTLQGSGLEDNALSMFGDFQKMISITGGSDTAIDSTMRAMTQMLSKGTVQAEELVGQLSEAMPQALNIAAKAMNMNKAELLAYIKTGNLLSTEFIPKFTAAMGQQADAFLQTAPEPYEAKLQKLQNTFGAISVEIGKGTIELKKPFIDGLNLILTKLLEFKEEVAKIALSIGAAIAMPILDSALAGMATAMKAIIAGVTKISTFIKSQVVQTEAVTVSAQARISTMFGTVKTSALAAAKAIGTVAKMLAPVVASFAVIEGFTGFSELANIAGTKEADRAVGRLDKVRDGLSGGDGDSTSPVQAMRTGNWFFDTIDTLINKPIQRLSEITGDERNVTMAEAFQQRKNSQSRRELFAMQDTTREIMSNVQRQGGMDSYVKQRAEIEKAIEDNAATVSALRSVNLPNAREQADALQKENIEREKQLKALNKQFFAMGDFNDELAKMQEKISALKQQIEETNDPTGELTQQLAEAQNEEKSLSRITEKLNQDLKEAKNNLGNLAKALTELDVVENVRRFQSRSRNIEARTDILGEVVAQGRSLNSSDNIQLANIDAQTARDEIDILKQSIAEAQSAIKATMDTSTAKGLVALLQQFDTNITSLDDATYEALAKVQAQADLEGNQKAIIDQLVKNKEKEQDLLSAQEQYNQAIINSINLAKERVDSFRAYANSLEDLNTSIEDYVRQRTRQTEDLSIQYDGLTLDISRQNRDLFESYESLGRQLEQNIREAKNDIDRLSAEIENQSLINEARGSLRIGGDGIFTGLVDFLGTLSQELEGLNQQQLSIEEQQYQVEQESLDIRKQIRGLTEQAEDLERSRLEQLRQLIRQQEDFVNQQVQGWRQIARQIEDMQSQAQSMGLDFGNIADNITNISGLFSQVYSQIQAWSQSFGQPSSGGSVSAGGFDSLLALLRRGEGDYNSINLGQRYGYKASTLPQRIGKNAEDLDISTILRLQRQGSFNAIGAYQFIPDTLEATAKSAGLDFSTKFTKEVQDQLAKQLLMDQPEFRKLIEQGANYTTDQLNRAINDVAKQWASVGVATPINGKRVDQSYYAGVNINKASITSDEVRKALVEALGSSGGSGQGGVPFFLKNKGVNDFGSGFYDVRVRNGVRGRHNGNDYAVPDGTPVYSAYSGTVTSTYNDRGEHGLHITSLDGKVVSQLNHLMDLSVKQGDVVTAGQQIGRSGGSKGSWGSTGSHLDAKIKVNGKYIPVEQFFANPTAYFNPNITKANNNTLPTLFNPVSTQIGNIQRKPTPPTKEQISEINQGNMAGLISDIRSYGFDFLKDAKELEELLTIGVAKDSQRLSVWMEQKNITLEMLNNKKIEKELQLELLKQEELKLNKQNQFKDLIDRTNEQIENLNNEYQDILKNVDDLAINAKGYLTFSEQQRYLIEDINNKYGEQKDRIKGLKEELNNLVDSDNTENTIAKISDFVEKLKSDSFASGVLGDSFFNQIDEGIKNSAGNAEGLLNIVTAGVDQINTRLSDAQKIEIQVTLDQNSLERQLEQLGSTSSLFGYVGDRLREQSPLGGGRELAIAREAEIMADYIQRIEELNEAQRKYAEDGDYGMVGKLRDIRIELERIKEQDIANIPAEVNEVIQGIGQPVGDFFNGILSDFVRGQASLKDLFIASLQQVADFLSQLAAQLAQQGFIKLLSGLFGGAIGGGGLIGSASAAPNALGTISGFAFKSSPVQVFKNGGTINNLANSGLIKDPLALGLGVMDAMKREGANAVPIVAHKGEAYLSAKNGDAQLFERLRKSGQWGQMKSNWRPNMAVGNYNFSGIVGAESGTGKVSRRRGNQQPTVINNNATFNIKTPNVSQFNQSRSMIAQQEKLRQERLSKRQ